MGDMPAGGMDMPEGMDGMGSGSTNMTMQVVKAYLGESTCLVADIDELQDAVEVGTSPPTPLALSLSPSRPALIIANPPLST